MRFNIYDRFVLEVIREKGQWLSYRTGEGIRRKVHELVIPSDLNESDLIVYLDDVLHELASPGTEIKILE